MSSDIAQSLDSKLILNSLNTPFIVFDIDDPRFTVIEENSAHARVAMVNREDVIGKPLLEAFPDTSDQYKETGVSQLLESIRKVIRTSKSDSMPRLEYDLKDHSGVWTKKFWDVTHHPIFDGDRVVAVYQDTRDITEEVLLNKQLERTQTTLRQVLASSLVGTWSWDLRANKIYAGENLSQMFGLSFEEAQKGLPLETFIQSIYPEDRERVEKEIADALKTLEPYETEYRTINIHKQVRWLIIRGLFTFDKNGKPELFSGISFDITDRKLSEQAFHESEDRLRFMADSMPQLVWVTQPDGYHEYYNQQWYDYTGMMPGSTDGEGWNDLFHPDDQARAWKLWKKSLKTGEPYEIEYRLYHAASKCYRWVIGRALPFKDASGKIIKWYGTCTDIDEYKRLNNVQTFIANASKELATTLDYDKILKKVTQLCVPTVADWCSIDIYSEEKGFEQVSIAHADPKKISEAKRFREKNPVTLDQPTGVPNILRTGKTEFYPDLSDKVLEQYIDDPETLAYMKTFHLRSIVIAPIILNKKVVGGMTFVSSDSGRYYTETDVHMAEELAGRISLAITNAKLYTDSRADIKKRQKLEKELLIEKQKLASRVKERTAQLQLTNEGLRDEITKRKAIELNLARSNAELEDFAYVASHDLQEPLRKIQAFSNLLQSEYSEQLGDGADYVARMHSAASRMSTLIQDLLAFSRVTTKTNPTQRIKLNDIVEDVLTDLSSRIEDTRGTVTVDDLPAVIADPTHMRQLMQNLIGNALKFHKPDVAPVVTVTSDTKDSNFNTLRISDNGIGFDEKYLDRIFSVFQRLHGRDVYDGTGIGLAVCRKIVERYGGSITAESSKNNGSTFVVRLPRIKEKTR